MKYSFCLAEADDDHMLTSDAPQSAFGFSTDRQPQVQPGGFNFY
jgi:hypothetical protein